MIACSQCGINQNETAQTCSVCGSYLSKKTSTFQEKYSIAQWEHRDGSLFENFFKLIGSIFSAPSAIFKRVRNSSSLSSAIFFYVLIILMTTPAQMVMQAIMDSSQMESTTDYFVLFGVVPVAVILISLFSLPFSIAWKYFLVLITGARKASFKQTFVSLTYAQAPAILMLLPIPFVMPLIVTVWSFVLEVFALAEINKTSRMRMFLTLFIPAVILFGLYMMLVIFLVVLVIAFIGAEYPSYSIQDFLELYR